MVSLILRDTVHAGLWTLSKFWSMKGCVLQDVCFGVYGCSKLHRFVNALDVKAT